ncbi:MAG: ABC transporter ATP-binding protein [Verrucomicrobia bacterium]|nr:ABC transporter ATP-binding protein [Verrucomicrobiota bacterium]
MTESASTTRPVVVAHDLHKTFKDFWRRPKVHALKGVDLEVQPGEIFGLLGPNGAGKSTLIKLLLGLLRPSSGDIRIFDQSPSDVRSKERIGYLPEETTLYRYLTARETLSFYARLFDLDAAARRERVDQLIEMIGLARAETRVVGEYSKGMGRRIGLAQALLNDPELLILDEPTSGLDPAGRRQIKDLIQALARRGRTVVLSSHLLADVEDICDRIAILFSGRVYALGRTRDLLEAEHRTRITFPEVTEEAMRTVLAAIQTASGVEPDVDRPTVPLEHFFLDVIESAQQSERDPTGATSGGELAPFLDRGSDHDPDP